MILEHEPVRSRPYQPPAQGKRRRRAPSLPFWGAGLSLLALAAVGVWHAVEPARLIKFEVVPSTATVRIEGPHLGIGDRVLLWRGRHAADVAAEGYYPRRVEFEAGDDAPQTVQVTLDPLPGRLRVSTKPEVDGEVRVDGKQVGTVGETMEGLSPGARDVRVDADGFKAHSLTVEVEGYGRLTEIEILLEKEKEKEKAAESALLSIASTPEAADILIDGAWQGRAPKQVALTPGAEAEIVLLLPGHAPDRQTLELKPGLQNHAATLVARTGELELWPTPANALVRIDGRAEPRRQLQLPQKAHTIEISAPGYLPQKHVVVPHPGAPKQIFATLQSKAAVERSRRRKHEQDLGLVFVGFQPRESFEIATTRRRIPVRLTRPFAVMDKEVTNALYQRYQSGHDSGAAFSERLDRPNQPVVRVGWAKAALFANWMSGQAGVAPFYRVRDGEVVGFDANAAGYRLPSEAEWVWLTRSERRYPWGDFMPPPDRFGNLADASAADIVQPVLEGYGDGHAVSAEVGSFPPSARGLYDLPGNVAEWMHDVFLDKLRISAGKETERVNPLGEAGGRFHVIRGFGWRDGGRKELSLTNRRYDRGPRDDVGFRLAYYLDVP